MSGDIGIVTRIEGWGKGITVRWMENLIENVCNDEIDSKIEVVAVKKRYEKRSDMVPLLLHTCILGGEEKGEVLVRYRGLECLAEESWEYLLSNREAFERFVLPFLGTKSLVQLIKNSKPALKGDEALQ